MESFKTQLEKQLKEKISQKANDKVSDEAYVIKAMRFFDIYNTGTVTYSQFHQSLERIGIYYTLEELLPLLSSYDPQQKLKIDYIDFSKQLYNSVVPKAHQRKLTSEDLVMETRELLDYFRRTLAGRAGNGLISLRKIFSIIDQDKNGQISIAEFSSIMKEFKIELSNEQINLIFKMFDMNKDGTLSYGEFLAGVRGTMGENRLLMVNKAFDVLDTSNQGFVNFQDLVSNCRVASHPAVMEGRKTEEAVLAEFLDTFEVHHNLVTGGLSDSRVTREEFVGYYDNISSTIGDDEYFSKLLDTSWNISGASQAKDEYDRSWVGTDQYGNKLESAYQYKNLDPADVKGATLRSGLESNDNPWQTTTPYYQVATADRRSVASSYKQRIPRDHTQITGEESKAHTFNTKVIDTYDKYLEQNKRPVTAPSAESNFSRKKEFELAMDRFKSQVIQRGTRGIIGLKRQMKILDDKNDGTLDMNNFQKGLEDYNIEVEARDLQTIYDAFNIYGTQDIDYGQLMGHIIGDLNQFRVSKVELAWKKLSAGQEDHMTWEAVLPSFNASRHPAVKAGYVTEEEIQYDFEETFKALHSVYHSFQPEQPLAKDEFYEYFRILSTTVPNDKVFDLILTGVWNIDLRNIDPKTGGIRQDFDFDGTKAAWKYDFHRSVYGKLDNSPFEHHVQQVNHAPHAMQRPKTAISNEMPTAGIYSWPDAKKSLLESNVSCLGADNLLTRTEVLKNDFSAPQNHTNGHNHQ